MSPAENTTTILDDLYAGTLDDAAWHRAIVAIVNLVRGSAAVLFGFNPMTARILRDENHRFDPGVLAAYRTYFVNRDVRIEPGLQVPVGHAMFERKLMPMRHWKGSEIYNDLLYPGDSPWVLAFWLHKALNKVVLLSIQGSRHRGAFDELDGEHIKPIIPHLRRALEIKDRLEIAQIRCDTLTASLDKSSFGVLILNVDGHILEANAAATQLLRTNIGMRRESDGMLWLREPAGKELDQWILAGTPPQGNTDGLLKVPRPGMQPISILVTPLPRKTTPWIAGDPRWMLLLFNPEQRIHASLEIIGRDLGISAREAEIAALLVAGYDLKNTALRLGISSHTVRTHVKAIFSKTGLCSQAELIRRIAGGPASVKQRGLRS